MIPAGENQLVQVASSEERLRALRELFGTTTLGGRLVWEKPA